MGVGRRERPLFALALLAMAVVAAIDIALGSRAVVVELLVAGPLIAATGASQTQTLIVSIIAIAIAIPLGLASDAFFEAAHVVGIIGVAIGGTLAVFIARLRARLERDSARLDAQY